MAEEEGFVDKPREKAPLAALTYKLATAIYARRTIIPAASRIGHLEEIRVILPVPGRRSPKMFLDVEADLPDQTEQELVQAGSIQPTSPGWVLNVMSERARCIRV